MKKNGFTLAEVLITLAIIGVVATMTLPALMTNTQEQQAKTGLKKAINTLTEAVQMHQAIDGFDFASMKHEATIDQLKGNEISEENENSLSFLAILQARTQIDYKNMGEDSYNIEVGGGDNGDWDTTVRFKDGTAVIFPSGIVANSDNSLKQSDGLPLGITIVVDTNGAKGPNVLSNCMAESLGAIDEVDDIGSTETEATCDKANRVIKDQFQVQLRGNVVEPFGEAARWAYNN
ncbi:MAG: type II secretion system protein [Cyanobacteria bacterium SIG31]|nr:type II secretion system protein [Cyanobacteria bacterium SIG31]